MRINYADGDTIIYLPVKQNTHNDAGCPRIEQQKGAHQESTDQHDADSLQKPVAQANVLLPEKERVATGITEHTMCLGSLIADSSHALNSCHKV